MEPGFPKRKIITDRGFNASPGGDGRYLWNINRVDKTVSIVDLSTNTVTNTVSCPNIVDYSTGNYVPADKCLYIHYNTGHYKIDLDPANGTFGTILTSNSNFSTTNSGNVVTYFQQLDAFIGVSNGFTVTPRLNPTGSYLISAKGGKNVVVGLAQSLGYIAIGGTNAANCSGWTSMLSTKVVSVGDSTSVVAPVINSKFYLQGIEIDIDMNFVRSVNLTGAQGAFMLAFCPRSKRLVGGGGNTSGWRLMVIDHKTFTLLGNTNYINSAGAPASSGYQYRDLVYSPFTGMMYAKPVYHAANTSDIHIYDCTQSLTSMYQSAIAVGNDRVPSFAPYNNCTMGLNMLKNDEYNY